MKDKETRDLIIVVVALLAFGGDAMCMAVQIQTLPYWMLRMIYIPVFVISIYSSIKADKIGRASCRERVCLSV